MGQATEGWPARKILDVLKNPDGYCPDHGTGVACPIGVGVEADV